MRHQAYQICVVMIHEHSFDNQIGVEGQIGWNDVGE
jgi:hypothetical protein